MPEPESPGFAAPVTTVTPGPTVTATLVPSPTRDLFAEVKVSQTALANEQIRLEQERQAIQNEQLALHIRLTADSATSTATAAVGQTAQALAVTQQASTRGVFETATAYGHTQVAMTQTAQILTQQYYADVAGIWIAKVFVLALAAIVLGGVGYAVLIALRGMHFKLSQMEPDENGRFRVVAKDAIPGADKALINPNLAHRARIDPIGDDLTPEQALANTQLHTQLEITRAVVRSPEVMRALVRNTAKGRDEFPGGGVTVSKPFQPLLEGSPLLAPSWSMVENWDGKGGVPYGVSADGLERVSLSQVPHGGIFGQTGKGKSRYFLRPFLAGALANGQRVVILGKQADFWPFGEHPNVNMIAVRHITEEAEAERYAGYLKRIVEEMNRRDDYLTSHRHSTWERAGRENTLIVLDELGNALDMMPRDSAREALRWVQGLVKEGRKTGFHVWLASQRAVGFKSIVEQLGRAVFYLADSDASRYALGFPGAETLGDGQFFAKFHGVKRCASFDPTDDELMRFLRDRSVPTHEPINWIEGEEVHEKPSGAEDDSAERKIRQVLERMRQEGSVSLSKAQREVFGEDDPRGGAHFREVQRVWIEIQAEAATATENKPATYELGGSATSSAL